MTKGKRGRNKYPDWIQFARRAKSHASRICDDEALQLKKIFSLLANIKTKADRDSAAVIVAQGFLESGPFSLAYEFVKQTGLPFSEFPFVYYAFERDNIAEAKKALEIDPRNINTPFRSSRTGDVIKTPVARLLSDGKDNPISKEKLKLCFEYHADMRFKSETANRTPVISLMHRSEKFVNYFLSDLLDNHPNLMYLDDNNKENLLNYYISKVSHADHGSGILNALIANGALEDIAQRKVRGEPHTDPLLHAIERPIRNIFNNLLVELIRYGWVYTEDEKQKISDYILSYEEKSNSPKYKATQAAKQRTIANNTMSNLFHVIWPMIDALRVGDIEGEDVIQRVSKISDSRISKPLLDLINHIQAESLSMPYDEDDFGLLLK